MRKPPVGRKAAKRNPVAPQEGGGQYWLYGVHPVAHALANPARRIHRLALAPGVDEAERIRGLAGDRRPAVDIEPLERAAMDRLLPGGAVHQGCALRVSTLPETHLDDYIDTYIDTAFDGRQGLLLALDRVTDPRNVGAILRAAAAFGAAAVILTRRHAPRESGALAKAAAGGLEHVPLIYVTNLGRALHRLGDAGFQRLGLDDSGAVDLAGHDCREAIVLVLGAEGAGLRRQTRDICDRLVRIPMAAAMESLNVASAAAVALYETARQRATVGR